MALDDLASEVTHCPFKQHSVPTETIPDSVREKIPQGHEYQEARLTGAISKAAHPSHQPTLSMDKSNCLFLPQFSLTLQEDLKIPLTNFPALVFLLENHYPKSKYNKKKKRSITLFPSSTTSQTNLSLLSLSWLLYSTFQM